MEIAVVGGDKRQCYLANSLIQAGFKVKIYDLCCGDIVTEAVSCFRMSDVLKDCEVLVLPTPVDAKWQDAVEFIREDVIVFGWNIPKAFHRFKTIDFGLINDVAIKNAIATAEGTIAEIIFNGEINISGSRSLITGFGKCGREIAARMKLLGSTVTIAARNNAAREMAALQGFNTCNMFDDVRLSNFDYIINTIPAKVITPQVIDKLSKNTVVIDIASAPGGTDFKYCQKKRIKALHSLSLPGKYSPKTSGEILGNVVIRHLTGGV